jgi:hypothetical protein
MGSFLLNGWITKDLALEFKEIYNALIKKAAKNA